MEAIYDKFTYIFGLLVELFGTIYTTGYFLIQFFTTPLANNLKPGETIPGLEEILSQTPLELMFGVGLVLVFVTAIIKFFLSLGG